MKKIEFVLGLAVLAKFVFESCEMVMFISVLVSCSPCFPPLFTSCDLVLAPHGPRSHLGPKGTIFYLDVPGS